MANVPPLAGEVKRLARGVGGVAGAKMMEALDTALSGPDMSQRVRFGTAMDMALLELGGYDPSPVPIRVKKRMRQDGQIRFALAATKAPIQSASFHFETRSTELRELLNSVFIKSGFVAELLRTSLNALDFGAQAHEQLWAVDEDHKVEWDQPNEQNGVDVKSKVFPQLYVPKTFKDLDPERVTYMTDNLGDLAGVVYGSAGVPYASVESVREAIRKGEVNVLDPRKCFVFTPGMEYQRIRGEGRLDWAYDPWYWQKIVYLIALRWYERKADPPLVCYAPTGQGLPGDDVDADTGLDGSATRVDGLVLGARAVSKVKSSGSVTLPSDVFRDDEGRPSSVRLWEIKELQVQDMHPAFIDFLDHLDKKKTRATLAADITLARDKQAGTLGSTEAIVQVALSMQNQTLQAYVRRFNETVLAPFLAYNGIKDAARLVTTGVLKDNQQALRDFLAKVMEADMLAEQAWGRVFPQSLTQMTDREALMREAGLPHRPVDPNAPMPKPPPAEPTDEAKAGKTKVSSAPKGKTNTGGGRAKAGIQMDYAEDDLSSDATDRARAFEAWASSPATTGSPRDTLTTYEKAAAAVMLWYLLRSPKDVAGKRVDGDESVQALAFSDGKVLSPKALADNLPALEAKAASLAGSGSSLHPDANQEFLPAARAALAETLGGLSPAVRGTSLNATVLSAVQQGGIDALALLDRFDPESEHKGLTEEAVQRIVRDNVEGIILNIENVARRNTQNAIERLLAGSGRRLGLTDDVLGFRFNTLYNDLSLEAHLRAAYRRSLVETSKSNGTHFFAKVPAGAADDMYDGEVRTDDFWSALGERMGAPQPHTTFGFHHGSTSYWYPAPGSSRIRMSMHPAAPIIVQAAPAPAAAPVTVNVTLPEGAIKVEPSPVTVNLPPQEPQKAPDIHLGITPPTPPAPTKRNVVFTRGPDGRITGAEVQE